MAAASIVPTMVQKIYMPSTLVSGTKKRLVKYVYQFTKATDGDWIETDTYFQSGTPLFWNACTVDTDGLQEGTVGMTWVAATADLTHSGGGTGVTYGEVWFSE
jgi:hypothetical protein